MPEWLTAVIGAAEVAGGVALDVWAGGAGGFGNMLINTGVGTLIRGVGTLLSKGPLQGFSTATRNPIAPWQIIYGRANTGGTLIFCHSWGDNDKYLDLVFVLAAHQCQDVYGLLFDRQRIQIDTTSHASGVPPSTFPAINGGTSFTPVQQTVNISTITRTNNVVQVTLAANIPLLLAGDYVIVQNVTGDHSLNGKYQVAEVINQVFGGPGSITFTYLSGGTADTFSGQGQVKTTWPDYGRKVYIEALTGTQTLGQTFVGMTTGTPSDGDTGNIINDGSQPWSAFCSCVGKTVVQLRLHYNDSYFANGLPQISFLAHGKNDIVDPRGGSPYSVGYTENPALCWNDVMCNKVWGLKCILGAPVKGVNLQRLIDAANVCDGDVPVAIPPSSPPAVKPRYTCNGKFQLTMKRGEIIQNLLTACAGRQTYLDGQFYLFPGGPQSPIQIGNPIVSATITYATGHTAGLNSGRNVAYNAIACVSAGVRLGENNGTLFPDSFLAFDDDDDGVHGWGPQFLTPPSTIYLAPGGPPRVQSNTWSTTGTFPKTWHGPVGFEAPYDNPLDTVLTFYQLGTIAGTAPIPDAFRVFGASMTVTWADGSSRTYTPTKWQVNVVPGAEGTGLILNPELAIDSDPTTFAEIQRGSFGVFTGWAFQLYDWKQVGGSPPNGPLDWTPSGTAESLTLLSNCLSFRWRPTGNVRDLFNGVKGTYIDQVNNWQSSDFPPYCQDYIHGYTEYASLAGSPPIGGDQTDVNVVYDGGDRRWLDIQLPFTIFSWEAQRLAKIELLRRRTSGGNPVGTGTFLFTLWAYNVTALDVISLTLPFLGWRGKELEVTASRLRVNADGSLVVELDVQETDQTGIFDWSIIEELSPQGYRQTEIPTASGPQPPTNVKAFPGPSIGFVEVLGVGQSTILVIWTAAADGYVLNGGHYEIQWQVVTIPPKKIWSNDTIPPSSTTYTIKQLQSGVSYNIQMRSVNAGGVPSAWVNATPYPLALTGALMDLWLVNGN